jgi:hypothetical protein
MPEQGHQAEQHAECGEVHFIGVFIFAPNVGLPALSGRISHFEQQ